jgi:type VI protein secretion system component Hcp
MSSEASATTRQPQSFMFILLEGIKGTATQPGYEGWIPLRAITHNVGTAMFRGFRKKKAGKEKDEEEKDSEGGDIIVDETEDEAYHRRMRSERKDNPPGNPSLSELTISASFGPHLPLLFQLGALRRPLRRAVIEHVVGRLTTRYTLRNVFLSGFSISADDDEDERHHSLSLNYQGPIELMMEERVRRPLALPSTPGFTSFDPHKADSGSFSLPLELIVMTFGWLDQQSLARAAMACKRFAFAANDEQIKCYVTHSAGYDLIAHTNTLNGQNVPNYWPEQKLSRYKSPPLE